MWSDSTLHRSSLRYASARRAARRIASLTEARRAKRLHAVSRACCEALEIRRLLSLTPAVNYPVDTNPQDVVTADLNKDGKLDLATANAGSSTVSVRLGNGAGGFGAATHFAVGDTPTSLAVGDFNNDGNPDLATGNATGQNVTVQLGNGTGTFQAPVNTSLFTDEPLAIAVGDLNGDGKMDLALSTTYYDYYHYSTYGTVEVLIGNGQGGFTPMGWYDTGSDRPVDIALADLNGDGKLDAATANEDVGTVGVLLGSGTGSFQGPMSHFGTGTTPQAVAFGDFTGDGKLDVITAGATVAVLPGNGSGSFAAPISTSVNNNWQVAVAVADFSGDGKLDAVTGDSTSDAVNLLLGKGNGAFDHAGEFATGAYPSAVAVGQINGDGRPDVAAANGGANTLSVLLNDGNWATLPPALRINDVSVVEGNSGTVNAVFTVTLERGPASGNVSVNFNTLNLGGDIDPPPWNSAIAGSDYVATSGTLTFTPGQTTKTITVPVKGDRVGEYEEQFAVKLSGAVNAQVFDGIGVGTIIDDEPVVSINNTTSVTEGDSGTTPMVFTVTLSAPSDQAVTVDYATYYWSWARAGIDYDAVSGTLTFLPGQTSKQFTVPIRGDLIDEFDKTLYVLLSNADNALASNPWGYGTIIDNDPPPAMVISNVSRAEGNSGTTAFTFTISLAQPSEKEARVNYGTAAGSASISGNNPDYQPKSGTLNFSPGQVSQTVTVSVYGDTRNESDETFAINLSSPVNATIADGQGVATILNDESRGKTWVGPASGGSWSTAANWSPSGVPAADSFVTISGASVTLSASAAVSELNLNAGATLALAPNGSRFLRTAGLYLAPDAKLNLNDNDMILDYAAGTASPLGAWNGSAYDGVSGMIARGYNFGGWDGSGLVTTRPDALNGITTLAVAEMSSLLGLSGSATALWQGQTVDATSVVIKYTYAGDANLDGQIDAGDYGIIDYFVQAPGIGGYANGDFNWDGFIDAGDYGVIDYMMQYQGLPL